MLSNVKAMELTHLLHPLRSASVVVAEELSSRGNASARRSGKENPRVAQYLQMNT